MTVCLPVCQCSCLSVCVYLGVRCFCVRVSLYVSLPVCVSLYASLPVCVCVCIRLHMYLSTCVSVYEYPPMYMCPAFQDLQMFWFVIPCREIWQIVS